MAALTGGLSPVRRAGPVQQDDEPVLDRDRGVERGDLTGDVGRSLVHFGGEHHGVNPGGSSGAPSPSGRGATGATPATRPACWGLAVASVAGVAPSPGGRG